jgi:predicted nucleic acid-binding protein
MARTNITLKLDADLVRDARIIAAEEGRSVNALVTELLESLVRERKGFDKARRRALARLRRGLDLQLWQERSAAISTQVLQELDVNLRRKVAVPLTTKPVQEIVADYLTWQVVVNDGAAIREALDFEERYGISFWNALIVQAAHTASASILCTEDLSDGQHYGNVRVENPLVDHVHEPQSSTA